MPTATWPSTLPQKLTPPTPMEPVDGRAMFQPDAGPVHIARQYTAEPVFHDVEMRMSESQWTVLNGTFWPTTLAGGVREFEWSNPWPSAGTKTFRFHSKPRPVSWTRKMNVASSSSSANVRLVSPATNPCRVALVSFRLIELPWWPAVG